MLSFCKVSFSRAHSGSVRIQAGVRLFKSLKKLKVQWRNHSINLTQKRSRTMAIFMLSNKQAQHFNVIKPSFEKEIKKTIGLPIPLLREGKEGKKKCNQGKIL